MIRERKREFKKERIIKNKMTKNKKGSIKIKTKEKENKNSEQR